MDVGHLEDPCGFRQKAKCGWGCQGDGQPFTLTAAVGVSGGDVVRRSQPASQGLMTCCGEARSCSVGMGPSVGWALVTRGPDHS